VHLPPPPPPPPEREVEAPQLSLQESGEEEPEQVELFEEVAVEPQLEEEEGNMHVEEMVELLEQPEEDVASNGDDDEIVFVGEVPASQRRRRRARREIDDDEYVVESVVDRRYFHGVEHFLIEWSGYGPEENSWELGHEKRVEIPDAISLYFQINGIADDGIMILRSRDEEFVEDRQPRERPFLARAAKRPRFS